MREIEVLYRVNMKKEEIIQKVRNVGAKFIGTNNVLDIYYHNENIKQLCPRGIILDACFRLRKSDFGNYMTYKENVLDENDIWQYCNEYETKVNDMNMAVKILENLNMKELIVVDNCKDTFKFENYEIVVEEEKTLGTFIEVELKVDDGQDYNIHKNNIREFVKTLDLQGVEEEISEGKPEMLLKRRGNNF